MNIRNIRLVRFPNGSYGVRKGWIWHSYFSGAWWYVVEQQLGMELCRMSESDARKLFELVRHGDEIIE